MMNEKKLVLVTGGSGFIAIHTMAKLLQKGYRVRASLRTMSRQDEVKAMLKQAGVSDLAELSFVKADLTDEASWIPAMDKVDAVMHIASPTPATRPDSADEMVKMAVDGLLNVFKAAKKAQVERIVLTSASGAVLAGHKNHPEIFTEEDWSDLSAPINAYQRSKTMAEQAAWKFAKENQLDLVSILPVAVMGPVLGQDFSHSNQAIKNMFEGKMPQLLRLAFDYIDVRDVADLHLLALENPQAVGERFLATTGENISYKAQAKLLKEHFGPQANQVSTREIPDFLVKFLAHFKKDLKMPATFLGQNTACSNAKAKKLLNWQPRSAESSIIATAQSMFDLGIIKKEK